MLKANTKTLLLILPLLTAVFIIGCSNPEKERLEQLKEASALTAEGNFTAALEVLEALSTQFPNDIEIIREIGDIYEREGNPTVAAFYYEQAYRLAPEDTELLFQTYQLQESAGNTEAAQNLLITLSEAAPDAMTPELWKRLGSLQASNKNFEPALQAYLKSVDPDKSVPDAETAAAIGDLFIKLDNLPMAERWLTMAADSNDPSAFTALFGLLEINLRNKNWTAAEANIVQLDAQFPGALDVSEWANARGELAKWRAAQEKMNAELAAAEVANKAKAEAAVEVVESDVVVVPNAEEDTETKDQIIEDMENMVAMVDAPALENDASNLIAFDPSITIEPSDPSFNLGVSYDQQSQGAGTNISVSENNSQAPTIVAPTPIPAPRIVTQQKSVEELHREADIESQNFNYEAAIRKYWQALGQANNRPDIWNMLSKAYLADSQPRNAETAALEATRLAPSELEYALDYLRVVQQSKRPGDFTAELETAYARFPRSPEIVLSLARAYDRINRNSIAAATYYNRFIEIAPNHPLRSEAEAALARLP